MYYEKLALEVNAAAAGLQVVKPALVKGKSGIDQKFTFVASNGEQAFGFDLCESVSEREVLRSYVKMVDTGASTFIVSLSGKPTPAAQALANDYGLGILGPGDVGDFFSKKLQFVRPMPGRVSKVLA